jgi:site-specific recombinase XerC
LVETGIGNLAESATSCGTGSATTLLRGGANLLATQECMRHASVASTALYTQVLDSERSAAVLALP